METDTKDLEISINMLLPFAKNILKKEGENTNKKIFILTNHSYYNNDDTEISDFYKIFKFIKICKKIDINNLYKVIEYYENKGFEIIYLIIENMGELFIDYELNFKNILNKLKEISVYYNFPIQLNHKNYFQYTFPSLQI